jgi:hypothetical protein
LNGLGWCRRSAANGGVSLTVSSVVLLPAVVLFVAVLAMSVVGLF